MKLRLTLTAVVSLAIGFVLGQSGQMLTAQTQSAAPRPAYMVVASRPIAPEKMGPYGQAAGPLAKQAGMEMLAQGEGIQVLEGKWPYSGRLTVERYRSMKDLLDFWNSPGYQQAKKLREGLLDVHFIVAIEGR
jgi:uncharacterized protein (DUF1330 family)